MRITINDNITLEIQEPAGLKPLLVDLVGSNPADGDPCPPSPRADGCWINMKAAELYAAYKEGCTIRFVRGGPEIIGEIVYELVFAASPKSEKSSDEQLRLAMPYSFVLVDNHGALLYTANSADDYPVLFREN